LIIKAPGYSNGEISMAMVEFVDLFPTLCDLCNLNIPKNVEGKSLLPLLEDPHVEWTDHVICKYHDGLTIRTPEYSYTEWRNAQDSLVSNMLYDHIHDENETNNLMHDEAYEEIGGELSIKMHKNKGADYFKENEVTTLIE
jgi:arylsulfatase A-like enzyme